MHRPAVQSAARRLNLLFPQWQGAGQLGLHRGARQLHRAIQSRYPFAEVPVSTTYSLAIADGILGHHQILAQLSQARDIIEASQPDHILTVGGDCGVEIAPVSFLNQRYDGDLAVIWLDAHADLNTPDSSPSGRFHGMPLRSLLGDGNADIVNQTFSAIRPGQVFLVGTREFDMPEATFVHTHRIPVIPATSVNHQAWDRLLSPIRAAGFTQVYLHLDLDVLEPSLFPHVTCPTPGGVHPSGLRALLRELCETFEVVGVSILEFCPRTVTPFQETETAFVVDCLNNLLRQIRRSPQRMEHS